MARWFDALSGRNAGRAVSCGGPEAEAVEQGHANGEHDGRQHQCGPCPRSWQHPVQASPDLLRPMVRAFAEALMGAQANGLCGAPSGSPAPRAGPYRAKWMVGQESG
jgi:hypothetical protein